MSETELDPIQPPDSFFVNAALGWLELGCPGEAERELAQLSPALSRHPAVLKLKWNVYAQLKNWSSARDTAQILTCLAPDDPQAWINLANALYFVRETRQAYDTLTPMAGRFPSVWMIPYNIACYACQLGNLDEARDWLTKAYETGDREKVEAAFQNDPDLEPLREKP